MTEQIESDAVRTKLFTSPTELSPQQLTSCVTTNGGCNGGSMNNAYNYVKSYGLEADSAIPYTSGDTDLTGSCNANPSRYLIGITSFKYITAGSESSIANYLLSTGPLSALVDATVWQTYTGGVLSSCGTKVNHAVQIVGIDTVNNYYIVSTISILHFRHYYYNFNIV